ncbi:four-carbon acid sugar kinase family protein [Streptococcus marmotae]|uniref:four-carbon acid sugar kinase family protein n=1 Tax=Streptococcus marmotae TaxID=1825069 RepID=UPI00082D6070|nr:four-carbon acid sugar kinase family protein [Streptococcus marmotae]
MVRLLVLADDFTGALDTGVQFSNLGVTTQVTTDIQIDLEQVDVDVLVIDTESRHLSFEASYQVVTRIATRVKELEIPYFYKKVDSALRGNISSEIQAILDVYTDRTIAFVPAYPAIGRTVSSGCLYIDGIPVSESIFADDPYEPVIESNIRKRLQIEANIHATLFTGRNSQLGSRLIIFDAKTEEDMSEIGLKLAKFKQLSVTVGCAGFAKVLAETIFETNERPNVSLTKPLVVICGSVNQVTQNQVLFAQQKGFKRYSLVREQLLNDDYWTTSKGISDISGYLRELEADKLAIFETFGAVNTFYDTDKAADIRFKIGQSLGQLTERLLENGVERTFLFTGGDTLYQSMQVLGISHVIPLIEISPGIVLSELVWKECRVPVITKSGGFGYKELFVDIVETVQVEKEKRC